MIGQLIVQLLKASDDLIALVDADNIYPYVADENTDLPLIVYTIDSLSPEYTKDGWAGEYVEFSVASFSEDYANLQAIVLAVREALELEKGDNTQAIIVTGLSEGYLDGVFGNKLSFSVYINN